MERLLIAGIETETGRHLVRQLGRRNEILGVPFSAGTPIPPCGIRRLPRTTPEAVRLLLEADAVTRVVYCGQASRSGWSSGIPETKPCSDTSELQAWSVACAEAGRPFAFVSSDIPFEGPWVFHEEESDSIADSPLALSIRQQEAFVLEFEDALIVRTHACGFAPGSLLTRRLLQESFTSSHPRRWYATPIYAGRFAGLLDGLIDRQAKGIYHLGGGERISQSQLASHLEERFRLKQRPAEGTVPDPRDESSAPRETSLRSSKARRLLQEGLPTIGDFLDDVAADLESGLARELAEVTVSMPAKVA